LNHEGLLFVGVTLVVGGTVGVIFPEATVGLSRDLVSSLGLEKGLPSIYLSPAACRLFGAIGMILGTLLVTGWLIAVAKG